MKNKKVLIIKISLYIIIITGIILGILYLTTDFLKSDQQLFYKYIAQTKIIDFDFINQYNIANNRMIKNSNSSLANLEVSKKVKNEETGNIDSEKILNVKSNGLENVLLKQSYRDFTFSSNNQNFLTLKYIRDNNTHGIIADNILTKYLAVENSNMKDFFTKLGVQDTTSIPNSIQTNYEELFKIDETTLNELRKIYTTLIYNNIDKENFYKIKNQDKTETIGFILTEQEFFNITKVILETAKNDNTLLELIVSKAQMLNYNEITLQGIQDEIQLYINELINSTYSNEEEFIKLDLIKNGKQVIKMALEVNSTKQTQKISESTDEVISEIEKREKQKIEIDFSETNKINLLIKENDTEVTNIIIGYINNDNNIDLNVEIKYSFGEEKNIIKVKYQIDNYQTDNIEQNLLININEDKEENCEISLLNKVILKQDIQISKLTTENSAKLNDMSSEELNQLFTAIINRIMALYGLPINILKVQ